MPAHRRHGHRQHHPGGRADRRVHRRRPGRGDRPGHRHRRRHVRPQGRGRARRRWPGTGPTRPTRSACWPRSAAWSTPRSPASSSAPPPARTPVVLDGVIAASAALAAAALAPDAVGRDGRRAPLGRAGRHRGAAPTSAWTRCSTWACAWARAPARVLALPIVAGAVRVLHEVATFDSRRAEVTRRASEPRTRSALRLDGPAGAGRRRRRGGHPAGAGAAGRRRAGRGGLAGADAGAARRWPTPAGCAWMRAPVRSRPTWTAPGWCRWRSTTRRRPPQVSAAAEERAGLLRTRRRPARRDRLDARR